MARSPVKRRSKGNTQSRSFVGGTGRSIAKLEKRIGQKELSKILGVSPRSIRRYKDGTRKPRFDIAFKIKRVERVSRGLRKTKSITKKRGRAEKIVERHPEVKYFEKKADFQYAETTHIAIRDVSRADIPVLLEYLVEQGCESAFLVYSGKTEKGERVFYQTEVMIIEDFEEAWDMLLTELKSRYHVLSFGDPKVDLVGIRHNASPVAEG